MLEVIAKILRELWEDHRGKVIGIWAGIFFGNIFLIFGLWKMLVVAGIVTLCFYLGKRSDRKKQLLNVGWLYRWMMERWNMFR